MIGIVLLSLTIAAIALMIITKPTTTNHPLGFKTFWIKKGSHYSICVGSWLNTTLKFGFAPRKLQWITIFGDGYNAKDKSNGDVHKLYGISYGLDHHYRSVRIGWRWNETMQAIELFAYWYYQSKRCIKKLCNVQPYEEFKCTIDCNNDGLIFVKVEEIAEYGTAVLASRFIQIKKQESWLRFKLFPYFGGSFPASEDIKIFIKEL